MRLVFDIESNGLLDTVDKCWIIGFKNKDTGEKKRWLNGDLGWMEYFDQASVLIGHNIIGYDLAVLKKLFDWSPKKTTKIQDTMLMSQVLNYRRHYNSGHSLKDWGDSLGLPKLEHNDWTQYSEEMEVYWERDLDVTDRVHNILMAEYRALAEKKPKITTYLKVENAVAQWCARAELEGWPFDVPAAKELYKRLEDDLNSVREKITPRLGTKCVAVDKRNGEVEVKKPKWNKNGDYNVHTANWFGIDPSTGLDEDRLIEGPYCRIEFVQLDLDSINDVKIFLNRNGWEPTEWNTKSIPDPEREGFFIKVNTSPKITEDSLECMQGDGKLYCDFLTTKSRHDILRGWLENVDSNGRLHGTCYTIGTPSMRARHSIIVNVPSADAAWGKEMRSLFTTLPGWKLIGCDSAGNQARGLAHYLKNDDFTHQLLNGDIHQYNADVLTTVLKDMGIDYKVPRSAAKRILYAFLFGASGGKLWSYIFGKINDSQGKKLKNGFTKAIPGFKDLLSKLESIYGATKQIGPGYIPGIAGNKIYCDSFHKLLVYLLQACEKATCGAAVMLTMQRLEEAGIPYVPLIMYHDEEDFMVPEEYAEQAAVIGRQAFIDGPKLFGIEIMDGGAKIGNNWYEIH